MRKDSEPRGRGLPGTLVGRGRRFALGRPHVLRLIVPRRWLLLLLLQHVRCIRRIIQWRLAVQMAVDPKPVILLHAGLVKKLRALVTSPLV